MTPERRTAADGMPKDEDMEEPSTEKESDEVVPAPEPDEPEPSHQAVGIGVVDDTEESASNDVD